MIKKMFALLPLLFATHVVLAFSPYEIYLQTDNVKHVGLIASVKPGQDDAFAQAFKGLLADDVAKEMKAAGIENFSCFKKVLNGKTWVVVHFDYWSKDYLVAAKTFENSSAAVKKLNAFIDPHPLAARYGSSWLQMEWVNYIRGSQSKAPTKQKYAKVTRIKPEMEEEYRILHQGVWPGVVDQMARGNNRNFAILMTEIDGTVYEFLYGEYVGDDPAKDAEMDGSDPVVRRWLTHTDPCQDPLPDAKGPWASMDLVAATK
jgi:L-rhamnose mutarotase